MKNSKRWLNATIAEAANCKVQMPWERGARRQEMIARRKAAEAAAKKVSPARAA